MEIPEILITQIREGNAVVFLGAGASRGTKSSSGKHCPSTYDLVEKLSDRFLGGKYKSSPLNQVGELAISETTLLDVQGFIRDLLTDLEPSAAHSKLPKFDWYGLGTTNYDQLVEAAYKSSTPNAQTLRPFVESSDRVDDNLKDPKNVLYIKLHGCITRINRADCPLILTTDQYVDHRSGRGRLFDVFKDWGYEHPIIFIGQSLQDSDLRTVIRQLTEEVGPNRPRYYLVAPDADEVLSRFWESKKITLLKGSFDEFMTAIDAAIPASFRHLGLLAQADREHEIERKFRVKTQLSRSALQFLNDDVEYVNGIASTETVEPGDFYRGYSSGFAPIEQKLDVRRTLVDEILTDYVLEDPEKEQQEIEMVLLKAHAGAGKSVVLRRLAWDTAKDFERIALFVKPQGVLNAAPLRELISACRERVFLFVDNASERVREIGSVLRNMGAEGRLLTIVLAERTNEWNSGGQGLASYVSDEYELRYLSMREIGKLLDLLAQYKALGTLDKLNREQQLDALAEKAGRQILVALYEATFGVSFENILVDEFNNIEPYDAQRLYLTVCVLNRLKVPVRAGVVARVHGIAFAEFNERLFSPLEHVVFAQYDDITRDYVYRARHPHIADIVFHRILANAEERFDVYIRCLKALNPAYTADRKAFWQMIRGRSLLDMFPDHRMVVDLYKVAKDTVGAEDAHLLHQMALYEMHRPNGSSAEANRLLSRAAKNDPTDVSIKHSEAEFVLRSIEGSQSRLERAKSLKDAALLSKELIADDKENAHAYHTLVKISIRQLQEGLQNEESEDAIAKYVKEAESQLFSASQLFPGDSYLAESEAELAKTLSDDKRALEAMVKAFDANPRNALIALRLAAIREQREEIPEAKIILKKALDANNADRRLHFAYGKLLSASSSAVGDELLYHFRRSFTPGDSNYDAQLLYGRELFVAGKIAENRETFASLSKARISPQQRNRLHYPIVGQRFTGKVWRVETNHAFVIRDGHGDLIFVHNSNVATGLWKRLATGELVTFSIAFTFRGASAFDLHLSNVLHNEAGGQLDLLLGDTSVL